MEADDLLDQLGQHVRDETSASATVADDPVWERLARGDLSPAENAQLRERAAADPQIATLYEAYRPLDELERARIAKRVDAGLHRPRFAPGRRVWLVAIAGPLAAAALVVLYLRLSPGPEPLVMVPEYSLELTGGDRATRSATPAQGGPVELHRSSHLEIVLRPTTAVKGPIVVRAFLVSDGGADARAWDVPMQRSTDGAVRIAGDAGTLLGVPAGAWDLVFTLSAEGATAPDPADVARAARSEGRTHPWRLLDARVRLLDGS